MARVVVPGCPHHVTQRGNRRQPTFFCDEDYAEYIRLMSVGPMLRMVGDWRRYPRGPDDEEALRTLRRHERTGRPLGDRRFLARLEASPAASSAPASPARRQWASGINYGVPGIPLRSPGRPKGSRDRKKRKNRLKNSS